MSIETQEARRLDWRLFLSGKVLKASYGLLKRRECSVVMYAGMATWNEVNNYSPCDGTLSRESRDLRQPGRCSAESARAVHRQGLRIPHQSITVCDNFVSNIFAQTLHISHHDRHQET